MRLAARGIGDGPGSAAGAQTRVVAAARGAIGARFRLQGRDPALGLDCVGLASLAMRAGGFTGEIPADYTLRGGDAARFRAAIDAAGLVRIARAAAGDLVLLAAGPAQFHLGIVSDLGLIHADAGLRRVVERPGVLPWPVIGAWRLPVSPGPESIGRNGHEGS